MTYEENVDRGEVVPELIIGIGGEDDLAKGEYVKLRQCPGDCEPAEVFVGAMESSSPKRIGCLWYWVRLVLLFMCLGLLAAVFIKWVGPFLMDRVNFSSFWFWVLFRTNVGCFLLRFLFLSKGC